jgi:hypothetical protein
MMIISRAEVQEMIDAAIRRHNRNASIISMCVGWVVLALFAEGLLRLVGVIPPLMRGHRGYSLRDYMKQDSTNMRKRIEEMLKDK